MKEKEGGKWRQLRQFEGSLGGGREEKTERREETDGKLV